jgi:hypothetical protein
MKNYPLCYFITVHLLLKFRNQTIRFDQNPRVKSLSKYQSANYSTEEIFSARKRLSYPGGSLTQKKKLNAQKN